MDGAEKRQGEWEGGRTYLSLARGRQPREELCSDGGCARLVEGPLSGAEADGERERTPHCPRRVSGRDWLVRADDVLGT